MAKEINAKIEPQIDFIILNILTPNLAKPNGYGDICEKPLSDPMSYFSNNGHVFSNYKNTSN